MSDSQPNIYLLILSAIILVSCLITCTEPACFYNCPNYLPESVTFVAQYIVDLLPFNKIWLLAFTQFTAFAFYLSKFGVTFFMSLVGTLQSIMDLMLIVLVYMYILWLIVIFGFGEEIKDQVIGYIKYSLGFFLKHINPSLLEAGQLQLMFNIIKFALAFKLAYFEMIVLSKLMAPLQWIFGIVLAYSMTLWLIGISGLKAGLMDQL